MRKSMRDFPRSPLTIAALSVVLAGVVGFDLTPWARGGFGWRWSYVPVELLRLLPLAVALVIYVVGAGVLLRGRQRTGLILLWSFVGALAIPLLVLGLRNDDVVFVLFSRTADPYVTGTHWAAARIDWASTYWYNWKQIAHNPELYSIHVAVAPPGFPIWYGLLGNGLDSVPTVSEPLQRWLMSYQCQNYNLLDYTPGQWASAVMGMLMPLWAALTVFPLHAVARRMELADRIAGAITLWWPLVPALSAFAGTWYTLLAPLVLFAFWWLRNSIEHRKGFGWLVASGLAMGIATFSNYATIPQVGLFGVFTLTYYAVRERQARPRLRPVIVGLWFGIGLAIPWMLYWVYTAVTPLAVFRAAFDLHLELERDYLPWVFLHPWDWILWNGFPIMLVWLAGCWVWARKRFGEPPVLSIALLLTIVVLSVSGTGRGESGRVWLMFTPFAMLAAGEALPWMSGETVIVRSWLILTSGNAILLVALVATLDAVGLGFSPPVQPGALIVDYTEHNSVFSTSDEQPVLQLVGWTATQADNAVNLALRWESVSRTTEVYGFGAVLIGPNEVVTEPILWQPGQERGVEMRYPTTCWMPGQTVEDTIRLPLPEDAEFGEWWISIAVFGDETQPEGRLLVVLPDETTDVQVRLGPVRIGD